jgi:two-component system cell cycle response regulator DivK
MKTPRVLIVDDNDLNIQLTTFILDHAAFCVESAADVIDAMHKVAAFKPDLILMDIQMPDLDGLELARLLKSSLSTRHIAIVAFTAYAMKGDEGKMLKAGCDGYISKPINVRTFADQVRAYCTSAAAPD